MTDQPVEFDVARCNRFYSPAGDALLRVGYPGGVSNNELMAQLNAVNLPGQRPWNHNALKHRAQKLHLSRSVEFRNAQNRLSRQRALERDGKSSGEPSAAALASRRRRTAAEAGTERQNVRAVEMTFDPPRDGGFSLALLEAAREVAGYARVACDRDTAFGWGRRWAGNGRDLGVINAKRRELVLPVFVLRD